MDAPTAAGLAAAVPEAQPFAPLTTGLAPLERLREEYERGLRAALTAIDAEQLTLVLPHRLTTLLTHIFPHGLTSLPKVAECVELTEELANVHSDTVAYLAAPTVEDVRAIGTHAALLLSMDHAPRRFHLLVAGDWSSICKEALEQHERQQPRLRDAFSVEELPWGFVPIDRDVLTLGRERCLFDCVVQGNKSVLVEVANGLRQLQATFGPFAHVKYKGELAAFVCQQLLDRDATAASRSAAASQTPGSRRKRRKMHTLVLLDRRVDYASALSTPLTFEALIAELFDGHDGFATVPSLDAAAESDEQTNGPPVLVPLNGADPMFAQVRDLHVRAVTPTLNTQARAMKEAFDHFRATSASASAAEVHDFVRTVPQMKANQSCLERLVGLLDRVEATVESRSFRDLWRLERAIMDADHEEDDIAEAIEDMIWRYDSLLQVLRVLCLLSVTRDGLSRAVLLRLKLQMVRTYGHETLFAFESLERLGLLTTREDKSDASSSSFHRVAQALQLVDHEVNVENPANTAFVTSGYAPLTSRLVETLLKDESWEAIGDAMQWLHGPRAEVRRIKSKAKEGDGSKTDEPRRPEAETKSRSSDVVSVDVTGTIAQIKKKRIMVVCLLGGVTYAEIAAIRWLGRFYPDEILVASTSVITGTSFVQDALDRLAATT
ncbi:hypothetical protein ATCC90586_002278 [Pythium insidiosum]|nr:hypothetical protein ATCC90586_002278 [Pythium insidiosum]